MDVQMDLPGTLYNGSGRAVHDFKLVPDRKLIDSSTLFSSDGLELIDIIENRTKIGRFQIVSAYLLYIRLPILQRNKFTTVTIVMQKQQYNHARK